MLKRVSIQNFKSLKDVTLDLQKINLLIGPNNSGKTNFLKALESFSRVGDNNKVSDFETLSFLHNKDEVIFEFLFSPNAEGYMVKSRPETANKKFYYRKRVFIKDDENLSSFSVNVKIDDWFVNEKGEEDDNLEVLGGNRREFIEYASTKAYRPDPSKLIHSTKLSGSDVTLDIIGSNLIEFYFYIYNNFEENAAAIQADLSRCIPEIVRFRTPPVEGENMLGLKFFDKTGISYWASEVSEGVLYFLILLCIVNQPKPPKFLLLEEPERGIHPRRIFEVIQFIFRLAEEKNIQIIMTTHSPTVVDMFKDMPESVFIFDKDEEGATHVKNLQRDVIDPETVKSNELGIELPHYTNSLGDAWTVGFLGGVPK